MSGFTLAIDGSTYAGSVALLQGSTVISERTLVDTGIPSKGGREERVLPFVAECLEECGVTVSQIARVVCGAGPGSFTSLRIAASVAKGIAVGVGCPLFSVSSLVLTVTGWPELAAIPQHQEVAGKSQPIRVPARYLSVLPAMRGEWYAAEIAVTAGSKIEASSALRIVGEGSLREAELAGLPVIGPGQALDARPHARGVALLLDAIVAGGAENNETWEPEYGRLAEAQVKWEAAHGRSLSSDG